MNSKTLALISQAKALPHRKNWTKEEIEIIRECKKQGVYPTNAIKAGLFPNRTVGSVREAFGRGAK
jgi:hypothetical protein